jgi:exopolyphosphatase/guanosine-5'-triphosphate,3'-diphosphate pyrophosphatase
MNVAGPSDDEGASAPPQGPAPRIAATAPLRQDAGALLSGRAVEPPPDAGASPAAVAGGAGTAARPETSWPRFRTLHSLPGNGGDPGPVYGALDLGTNNCRLLLARPSRRGFRVVDAFSRIIRLGEGVSHTGRLSAPAMDRTLEALKICAGKLDRNGVERARCVATEACRVAENGEEFLNRVVEETGLRLEILDRETEAGLAVSGCASLIDRRADYVLVFDIGGGSSELIWLDLARSRTRAPAEFFERLAVRSSFAAWTSLPVGVVTLAERFGGHHVTPQSFEAMVAHVTELVLPFEERHAFRNRTAGAYVHMLGTSGTVTTVAGIKLGLARYERSRVDGCWLDVSEVRKVTYGLLARTYAERVAEPCIGHERADLVLAGCAILEALLRIWPAERLRVADRGLREGILTTLMSEDGVYRAGRRRRRHKAPR